MANTARTVKDMCEHASMLVPMAIPQTRLRSNINMDMQSPWHATALLSTAMETAGIASRLGVSGTGSGLQANLSDLVAGLNLRGRQTMSRLQMSVAGPASELKNGHDASRPTTDGEEENENTKLDTDFFDILRVKPASGRRNRGSTGSTPHLFGQTITTRGTPEASDDTDECEQRPKAALVETSTQR